MARPTSLRRHINSEYIRISEDKAGVEEQFKSGASSAVSAARNDTPPGICVEAAASHEGAPQSIPTTGPDPFFATPHTLDNFFTKEELRLINEQSGRDPIMFSNGDGAHFKQWMQSWAETKGRKDESKVLFDRNNYAPSNALIAAALMCFTYKKKRRHFFKNGVYLISIFARELDIPLSSMLTLRGWLLRHNRKSRRVSVSYRRTAECLKTFTLPQVNNYFRISAIMDNLYRIISSTEMLPDVPYDRAGAPDRTRRRHNKDKATAIDEGNNDGCEDDKDDRSKSTKATAIDECVDERAGAPDRQTRRRRNKRKATAIDEGDNDDNIDEDEDKADADMKSGEIDDDDVDPDSRDDDDDLDEDEDEDQADAVLHDVFRERSRRILTIPTFRQIRLVDYYRKSSAHSQFNRYLQVFQLGFVCIRHCFEPVMNVQLHYKRDPEFTVKLFLVIFSNCSDRKQMLQGIQSLFMFCTKEEDVRRNRNKLRGWLEGDMSQVIPNAAVEAASISEETYFRRLQDMVRQSFLPKKPGPKADEFERERIIAQFVTYVYLKGSWHNKRKESDSPFTEYRNGQTPVEKDIEKKKTDDTNAEPSLGVQRQLNEAASIFDPSVRQIIQQVPATATDPVTPPPSVGPSTPSVTMLTDNESAILNLRVATLEETRSCNHRFVLWQDFGEVRLHHHPMEVYLTWKLHQTAHSYENLGPKTNGRRFEDRSGVTIDIPDNQQYAVAPGLDGGPCMVVVRPGSTIYEESFPPDSFPDHFPALFRFLFRNSTTDPSRSNGGWRIDINNAGQAFEVDENNMQRPMFLCGTAIFDRDPEGEIVRALLGRLVDPLCRAAERMTTDVGRPHILNQRRYREYGFKLQQFIFAKESYVENITVQLLDLTLGHTGCPHKDTMNDPRESYNRCFCKVMFLVDQVGHLYSLKIVCSFRKRLGDYYSIARRKFEVILSCCRKMTSQANAAYRKLANYNQGSWHPSITPQWNDMKSLTLHDGLPWNTLKLGIRQLDQEFFPLETGVYRGFWLSAALSAIYRLAPHLTESGILQLMVILAWQNSFHHFYAVCESIDPNDLTELTEEGSELTASGEKVVGEAESGDGSDGACTGKKRKYLPIFLYYKKAKELFYDKKAHKSSQFMYGGLHPRFSSGSVDFQEAFGDDEHPKFDRVSNVVGAIEEMCVAMNNLCSCTDDAQITRANVLAIINVAKEKIKGTGAHCQLGEFRLMILLQACTHLGLLFDPGSNTRKIFFPLQGTAAYSHIESVIQYDMGKNTSMAETVDVVANELIDELSTKDRPLFMDNIEALLCESFGTRELKKFDVFIRGQMLFWLDEKGQPWMKEYGPDKDWIKVKRCWKQSTATGAQAVAGS